MTDNTRQRSVAQDHPLLYAYAALLIALMAASFLGLSRDIYLVHTHRIRVDAAMGALGTQAVETVIVIAGLIQLAIILTMIRLVTARENQPVRKILKIMFGVWLFVGVVEVKNLSLYGEIFIVLELYATYVLLKMVPDLAPVKVKKKKKRS